MYRSSEHADSGDTADNQRRLADKNKAGENRWASALRSAGFIAGFLVFLAFIALASALGPNAKVVIKGNQPALRPISQYSDKAESILGQSLNNRWKFSIKRSDIAAAMKQAFPEIGEASVSTPPWYYEPVINISMSEPSILLISAGGDKHIVNEQGVAVADADSAKTVYDAGNLPTVTDETGYEVVSGKNILSSQQVSFIKEVIFQAGQKRLHAAKILLKPGGQEVHFEFDGLGYIVKFNFDNDARRSVGAFLALRKHLESSGPMPSEYIDVRVPERAYVR